VVGCTVVVNVVVSKAVTVSSNVVASVVKSGVLCVVESPEGKKKLHKY
jgi:hypothetical protein